MNIKHFHHKIFATLFLGTFALMSCTAESPVTDPMPEKQDTITLSQGFAKGADVSWLTKLEMEGNKFYTPMRVEKECMQLLHDNCGVNAIRLRVMVNPSDGWSNTDDVIIKARRAHALGMRLMIDFFIDGAPTTALDCFK